MTTRATKSVSAVPQGFRRASAGGYLPAEQSATIRFKGDDAPEDAPAIEVKIRTNLINEDLDRLRRDSNLLATMMAADNPDDTRSAEEKAQARKDAEKVVLEEMWDNLAPFILDWNIQHRADDGQVYDVLPPSEIGGSAFAYMPVGLYQPLLHAVIGRTYQRIDPKSSASSATTEDS